MDTSYYIWFCKILKSLLCLPLVGWCFTLLLLPSFLHMKKKGKVKLCNWLKLIIKNHYLILPLKHLSHHFFFFFVNCCSTQLFICFEPFLPSLFLEPLYLCWIIIIVCNLFNFANKLIFLIVRLFLNTSICLSNSSTIFSRNMNDC